MEDIQKFKYEICYTFKDMELLREVLTHPSYARENELEYDNQRLEHLGDAVIDLVLTEYLYKRYPSDQEGNLTKLRSALAKRATLASFAREINIGNFLRLGKGEEETGGRERESNLADVFESLCGALYLEAGLERTRSFLIPLLETLYPDPVNMLSDLNPKGTLQEYTQGTFGMVPIYEQVSVSGPDHSPSYTVRVSINNQTIADGTASKRKNAEGLAAQSALARLQALDTDAQNSLVGIQKRESVPEETEQQTEEDSPSASE